MASGSVRPILLHDQVVVRVVPLSLSGHSMHGWNISVQALGMGMI